MAEHEVDGKGTGMSEDAAVGGGEDRWMEAEVETEPDGERGGGMAGGRSIARMVAVTTVGVDVGRIVDVVASSSFSGATEGATEGVVDGATVIEAKPAAKAADAALRFTSVDDAPEAATVDLLMGLNDGRAGLFRVRSFRAGAEMGT